MNAKLGVFKTEELIEELKYRIRNGESIGYALIKVDEKKIKMRHATSDEIMRCRMTKEDFLEDVETGCICDDDGNGYWGTATEISNISCFKPSPEGMKFVYWYNK